MEKKDIINEANELIEKECKDLVEFLKRKNKDYQASSFRGIKLLERNEARILDKIYRLLNECEGRQEMNFNEDTTKDLCGYLIIRIVLLKYGK